MTPELRHLQVSLGAQLSYRKAADLLRMLLPPTGGTTHTSTRARLMAVGERIDEEIRQEITENRKPDKPAKQMIIGIDGAFVKGRPPTDRANLEIITGRTSWIGITLHGVLRLSEKASSIFLMSRISNTGCRDTGIT